MCPCTACVRVTHGWPDDIWDATSFTEPRCEYYLPVYVAGCPFTWGERRAIPRIGRLNELLELKPVKLVPLSSLLRFIGSAGPFTPLCPPARLGRSLPVGYDPVPVHRDFSDSIVRRSLWGRARHVARTRIHASLVRSSFTRRHRADSETILQCRFLPPVESNSAPCLLRV
jgi:hypothetical protein